MRKVLLAGTFDILHPGHLNLLKQAKEFGDFLIVVVARDKNVMEIKGRKPFYSETERLDNLNKISLVDKVVLGDIKNPYKVIELEKPEVVALGYDQQQYVSGLQQLKVNSNFSFKIERLEPFKDNIFKGKNVRQVFEDPNSGFLLINKEEGWTSHDVVAKLRSITKIKSIGHTGTLDPFATGLLICALGKATKMVEYFNTLPKIYEAEVKLGVVSDTYDRTGGIKKSENQEVRKLEIEKVLKFFIGKQKQLPPMYSAKKIQGRKLYQLARQGKVVERKPSEIEIYSLEFLSDERGMTSNVAPHTSFIIRVTCSTGTYIRSLAHDIGQKLGTGAILNELKRTAIGDFKVKESVKLSELTKENYKDFLISPQKALEAINQEYLKPTAP